MELISGFNNRKLAGRKLWICVAQQAWPSLRKMRGIVAFYAFYGAGYSYSLRRFHSQKNYEHYANHMRAAGERSRSSIQIECVDFMNTKLFII